MPINLPVDDARVRGEASCSLMAGSRLLMYSDGLIERRSETIDDGMTRLATAFSARRDDPPATLVASLLHELRDAEHPDDVCLLVADV
jgi:serine/threonine-protein kinase RsbW